VLSTKSSIIFNPSTAVDAEARLLGKQLVCKQLDKRRRDLNTEDLKILVADDDRIVRRIVVTKLSGLGYEITDVEDGREALDLLEGGDVPDLLITDSNMPRMNGLQLTRTLRASSDPNLSTLPIIMLTSRQGEQDILEGLETGLDDYIIKPFSPDELAARVRTTLWRSKR
jgi:DNA-binding response OmpR family regulator